MRHGLRATFVLALVVLHLSSSTSNSNSSGPDRAPPPQSIQAALDRLSRAWSATSDDEARDLLTQLSSLLNATGSLLQPTHHATPHVVPELTVPGVSDFLASTLTTYGDLSADNLGSWASHACSFLDAHVDSLAKHYAAEGQLEAEAGHDLSTNSSSSSSSSSSVPHVHHAMHPASGVHEASVPLHYAGLPLVRRALLAQLAAAWLTRLGQQIPSDPDTAGKLACVIRRLYEVHADSLAARGLMEYLHVSKCGGTSWIVVAKRNGCMLSRGRGAQAPLLDDACRWVDHAVMTRLTNHSLPFVPWGRWGQVQRNSSIHGCAARRAHVAEGGSHVFTNEYTLQGGLRDVRGAHLCPQLFNVVMIREPLKRITSHIRFMLPYIKGHLQKRGYSDPENLFTRVFCNTTEPFWELYSPPVVDNYITRSFLGEQGFHTPLHGLAAEHVSLARALLLQVDLVLDLDAGNDATDWTMEQTLGWRLGMSKVHTLSSARIAEQFRVNFESCTPGQLDGVMGRQQLDQQFYSFGRLVSGLDLVFADASSELGMQPQLFHLPTHGARPVGNKTCGLLGVLRHGRKKAASTGMAAPSGKPDTLADDEGAASDS